MTASPHSPTAAELKNIRFSYDHGSTWALDDVSLTIQAGERVCLVGPNGSGKSTLARLIAGLTAPDAGKVTLLGHRVFSDDGPNAAEYRAARRGIGVVFQNPEDQLVTTVLEDDVAFGPENLGLDRAIIGKRIQQSLEAVDLANVRRADPTRMSGGQQQRSAIAGMLAMNPSMLVLDEPTAMLDETARAEVMRVLDALQKRGTTIVHVTHHTDETRHADRVIHMRSGHIIKDAPGSAAAQCPKTAESSAVDDLHHGSHPIASLPLLSDLSYLSTSTANATPPPAIRVSHLTYRYAGGEQPVIDDLSFSIQQGETIALMGSNGSGKSTLVRLLCALAKPDSGSIEVAGIPVARPKPANRRQLAELRRHVGYVMQHPEHQLFAETVAEDVAYGPRNQGLGEAEVNERVHEALSMLHIEHLADRSPFDLSGGQQRLAAIAGVVACRPDVLIMDEPTASLDVHAKARIHELLQTLRKRGVTMLIITHDRAEAEALADHVVRMPAAAETSQQDRTRSASTPMDATPVAPVVPAAPANIPRTAMGDSPTARSTGGRKSDFSDIAASEDTAKQPTSAASGNSGRDRRSPIHRLDPRVKMVGFLAAMFTMFAVNTPVQLALGIALTLAVMAAARLNPIRVFAAIHPLLALLALMSLCNLVVVRTGTPLLAWGPLSITDDGATIAVLYTCRFALVIIMGAMFLMTTTPTAMTDAFEALLRPFSRFGLHTQEIALVMSLALRFIPTLTGETRAIVDAQAARGGSIETGSLAQRVKAMSAIIVPVFAGTLRHADNLSLALDARCYEEGISRTHWRVFAPALRDAVFATAVIAYIAAIVVL
ncbi:energy-coupling factor transporter ATPase [Bifidobacterium sp. SO4]|uniref:energy-coupling factor transporter ATPase n=1 Tax=Bifidobacterium sp. SO4 TaxID=2809030 RepID=UPI001BDD17FC|nr:energy-coupling factor transporter ATPase [Bifidobacterium sp. SO4]MBT1171689.1 ATP-binding cassette domain-containing protein [Bifidobacterium sp. SO4]